MSFTAKPKLFDLSGTLAANYQNAVVITFQFCKNIAGNAPLLGLNFEGYARSWRSLASKMRASSQYWGGKGGVT
jgi:hypothetical protein